ncbi:Rieske 2Fe-2S domain-containing protein [Rhodococcus sp. NPDC056960]|uniref:Rieske 2Fe-2S domain-containing protein n=1 Tax=Rhodococcus sp. NPDC056960 TaxID=3345982 RepID=UPI003629F4BF
MYPVTFPRNHWYVAGHAQDFDRALMSRWILGDPICFYRRQDGAPVALVDRCIHRQMPLSLGRLKGDDLECGYHGILYGDDGQARRIPAQAHVPPACRVHRYPTRESGGLVWIWMGDPDKADESMIPAHPWLESQDWTVVRGTLHLDARAQLINENLLDLSHVSFLHPETIGTEEVAESPVSTDFDERSVRVTRAMFDIQSPPLFQQVMGLNGRIDREQIAEFIAPNFHITHVTAKPAGADPEGDQVCRHKAIHCITPERGNSAHYFWAVTRDYRTDDHEVSTLWEQGTPTVFGQDIAAAEAIERVISAYEPGYPTELNMKVDGGPLRARRIIERMIADESETRTETA